MMKQAKACSDRPSENSAARKLFGVIGVPQSDPVATPRVSAAGA